MSNITAKQNDAGESLLATCLQPATGCLGDYRLVREIGRGGMGVVYEAEQVSLGRRVALKVLPFAAAMDPRQLQRFQNEARAAAGLHHEHVVPVYAVGCERGQHFIAMQYIDGTTLAKLIQVAHVPAAIPVEPGDATCDFDPAKPAPHPRPAGGDSPTPPVAGLTTENGKRGRAFYRSVARLTAEAAE